MPDIDAIEAINFEQLATITDRLLLRRGQGSKKRPSYQRIEIERVDLAPELTLRAKPNDIWRRFTTTALLMALFSVSAAIATLI